MTIQGRHKGWKPTQRMDGFVPPRQIWPPTTTADREREGGHTHFPSRSHHTDIDADAATRIYEATSTTIYRDFSYDEQRIFKSEPCLPRTLKMGGAETRGREGRCLAVRRD